MKFFPPSVNVAWYAKSDTKLKQKECLKTSNFICSPNNFFFFTCNQCPHNYFSAFFSFNQYLLHIAAKKISSEPLTTSHSSWLFNHASLFGNNHLIIKVCMLENHQANQSSKAFRRIRTWGVGWDKLNGNEWEAIDVLFLLINMKTDKFFPTLKKKYRKYKKAFLGTAQLLKKRV